MVDAVQIPMFPLYNDGVIMIDSVSFGVAKMAVENWHYSKIINTNSVYRFGIWEFDRFIGCIVFSSGASPDIGTPYGLTQCKVCELVRIALSTHVSPVTQLLAICLKIIKRKFPSLRLIVSFADKEQGHLGIIYQANNWIYVGETGSSRSFVHPNGKREHFATIRNIQKRKYRNLTRTEVAKKLGLKIMNHLPKHKYLMPLDRQMRKQIAPLAKPYPKA